MNCCCCVPGRICVIIGVVLGLSEIILAAVVNFHTFGFLLGLLCMVGSAGFFFYLYKLAKSEEGGSMNDSQE